MAFTQVTTLDHLAPGTAIAAQLEGEPICVVRRLDGQVRAVHDTCSHQEYALHEGWVDADGIECALHGSMFDLDTGKPTGLPAVRAIPTYACELRGDAVWVDGAQQTNDAPVPRH